MKFKIFLFTILFTIGAFAGITITPPSGGGGGGGNAWSDPIDSNMTVDTDTTYSMGTFGGGLAAVHAGNLYLGEANLIQDTLKIGDVSGALPSGSLINYGISADKFGTTINFGIYTADQTSTPSGSLYFETGNGTTAATSGGLFFRTGELTGGTGDTGDISFDVSASFGGTQGKVAVNSRLLDVSSGIKSASVTADPCGDATSFPIGTLFYNSTSNYFCFCGAANADVQMHSPATACF